jgi:hypothetical protein
MPKTKTLHFLVFYYTFRKLSFWEGNQGINKDLEEIKQDFN